MTSTPARRPSHSIGLRRRFRIEPTVMGRNQLWMVLEDGRPLTMFMDQENAWSFVATLARQLLDGEGRCVEAELLDARGRAVRHCAWERLEAA